MIFFLSKERLNPPGERVRVLKIQIKYTPVYESIYSNPIPTTYIN